MRNSKAYTRSTSPSANARALPPPFSLMINKRITAPIAPREEHRRSTGVLADGHLQIIIGYRVIIGRDLFGSR